MFFGSVISLGLPGDDHAQLLLHTACSFVEDIMRERKWIVEVLKEFCPRSSRLLGLNVSRGREVYIRLRRSKSSVEFFSLEAVIGTLLHELVHNSIGGHRKPFKTLLEVITRQCEERMCRSHLYPHVSLAPPLYCNGEKLGGDLVRYKATSRRELSRTAAEQRLAESNEFNGNLVCFSDRAIV